MGTGKLSYFHYKFYYKLLEEETPRDFTPADMNYLFGIEPRCEIIFSEHPSYDFMIVSLDPKDNEYLRGVDVSLRRKLDELGLIYSFWSGYND